MYVSQLASHDELTAVCSINTKLHTPTVLGNSCNLLLYYASTCTLYVDPLTAGPANQVLWEAKQVWQNMLLLYVLSYTIVFVLPTINTWYFVMGID